MRVAYIISNINYSISFEWIAKELRNSSIQLHFIFLNAKKPDLYLKLEETGASCFYIPYKRKQDLLKSFFKLSSLLAKLKIKAVHCHLFEANLLGLFAAKVLGIQKRIYTRHHSSYHHDYYPSAVKYDKFVNSLATDIIAISGNVEKVLIEDEKVALSKIHKIEHGFDLKAFSEVSSNRVDELRIKYNIPVGKKIIGVIARYIDWKGHEYIIQAIQEILKGRSDIHLILANAEGPDKKSVQNSLSSLRKETYTEIVFEKDLFALYQLFDVYVHVPINSRIEAFGQTYIEALAAGVPSIFSLSGIANDFVNEGNAMIVDYKNSIEIAQAIQQLLEDKELMNRLIIAGKASVQSFDKKQMISSLKDLYLR